MCLFLFNWHVISGERRIWPADNCCINLTICDESRTNVIRLRMSTFLGLVEEIPGISVDRFDADNLSSSVFFLSHCHSDHTIGLSEDFFRNLERNRKCLYCSPLSKMLLESKYKFETACVQGIDINSPTVIEYQTKDNENIVISVTCVSAGHCPGSVMFLFERNNASILYTGDFRINPADLPKLKGLHYYQDSTLSPRVFQKIYLDTTFLSPDYRDLPSRQESMLKVCNVTTEWLAKDPRNVVILECSALYGSEFLFMELSKALEKRIHVKDYVYHSYRRVVELSSHVTNDPYSTPIHACMQKFDRCSLKCRRNVDKVNILTIVPSVMKWKGKDATVVGEWDEESDRTYNVCYSTHSSLNELKAFLRYFKAAEVYPCVVNAKKKKQIYALLKEITMETETQLPVKRKEICRLEIPNRTVLNKSPFKSLYFSDDDDSL